MSAEQSFFDGCASALEKNIRKNLMQSEIVDGYFRQHRTPLSDVILWMLSTKRVNTVTQRLKHVVALVKHLCIMFNTTPLCTYEDDDVLQVIGTLWESFLDEDESKYKDSINRVSALIEERGAKIEEILNLLKLAKETYFKKYVFCPKKTKYVLRGFSNEILDNIKEEWNSGFTPGQRKVFHEKVVALIGVATYFIGERNMKNEKLYDKPSANNLELYVGEYRICRELILLAEKKYWRS